MLITKWLKIISKFWDTEKDREGQRDPASCSPWVAKSQTWVTEQPPSPNGTSHPCKVICVTKYLKLYSKAWEISMSKKLANVRWYVQFLHIYKMNIKSLCMINITRLWVWRKNWGVMCLYSCYCNLCLYPCYRKSPALVTYNK